MGTEVSPLLLKLSPPNTTKSWFLTLNLKAMKIRDDCMQKKKNLLSAIINCKFRAAASNGTN
jgi:hypothetical protein